jgi:hypothetical protein
VITISLCKANDISFLTPIPHSAWLVSPVRQLLCEVAQIKLRSCICDSQYMQCVNWKTVATLRVKQRVHKLLCFMYFLFRNKFYRFLFSKPNCRSFLSLFCAAISVISALLYCPLSIRYSCVALILHQLYSDTTKNLFSFKCLCRQKK